MAERSGGMALVVSALAVGAVIGPRLGGPSQGDALRAAARDLTPFFADALGGALAEGAADSGVTLRDSARGGATAAPRSPCALILPSRGEAANLTPRAEARDSTEARAAYRTACQLLDDFYGAKVDSARPAPDTLEVLVATIPDPLDSQLDWAFDAHLDAMRRAYETSGFVLDRYWLPWTADRERARQSEEARALENVANRLAAGRGSRVVEPTRRLRTKRPGVLLFRSLRPADSHVRLLYLVGETATAGAYGDALLAALDERCALLSSGAFARAARGANTLRVVGPLFSGASRSIARALDEWMRSRGAAAARCADPVISVISGGANAPSNLPTFGALVKPPARVAFSATVNPTSSLTAVLERTLANLDICPWEVALLRESGTQYGRSITGRVDSLRGAHTPNPARSQLAALVGRHQLAERCVVGIAAYDSTRGLLDQFALGVPVPMNISDLRAEYARTPDPASAQQTARARPRLPLELQSGARSVESTPLLSSLTAPATDLLLDEMAQTLVHNRIRLAGLLMTDVRDRLFLGAELRRRVRDVRLFTFGANILYARPEYASALRGMLVFSSYPLSVLSQEWNEHAVGAPRLTFASDGAAGTYNATLMQLGLDSALTDYTVFAPARGMTRPPVWTSVVASGGLLPVRGERSFPRDVERERADYVAAGPIVLGVPARRATLGEHWRFCLDLSLFAILGIGFPLLLRADITHRFLGTEPASAPTTVPLDSAAFSGLTAGARAERMLGHASTYVATAAIAWGSALALLALPLLFNDSAAVRLREEWGFVIPVLLVLFLLVVAVLWRAEHRDAIGKSEGTGRDRLVSALDYVLVALGALFTLAFVGMASGSRWWWFAAGGGALLAVALVLIARLVDEAVMSDQGALTDAADASMAQAQELERRQRLSTGEERRRLRKWRAARIAEARRGYAAARAIAGEYWPRFHDKLDRPAIGALLAFAAAYSAMVLWFLFEVALLSDDASRLPFLHRMRHLTSGVSPLLPLLVAAVGFVLWSLYQLQRVRLLRRWSGFELALLAREGRRGDWVDDAGEAARRTRMHLTWFVPDATTLALGICVALVGTWLIFQMPRSIEATVLPVRGVGSTAFDVLFRVTVIAALVSTVWTLHRFLTVWSDCQLVLDKLGDCRLLEAFERLPRRIARLTRLTLVGDDYQESVRRTSELQARHLEQLRKIDIWSKMEPAVTSEIDAFLQVLRGEERGASEPATQGTEFGAYTPAPSSPESVPAPEREPAMAGAAASRTSGASASSAAVAPEAQSNGAVKRISTELRLRLFGGDALAERVPVRGPIFDQLLVALARFWQDEPDAELTAKVMESLDGKKDDGPASTSGRLRRGVGSKTRLWLRTAEELAAVQVVEYLAWVFRHLRNMAVFLVLSLLLTIALLASYPFQPESLVKTLFMIILMLTVGAILLVMVQMNRDEVLSRITKTDPGRVTWDRTFVLNGLLVGIVPMATFIGSQFPAVRDNLFFWLEPLQRLIGR